MTTSKLLVVPKLEAAEYQRVSPETAGWQLLHFAARLLQPKESWEFDTGDCEYGVVLLGGVCQVETSRGEWERVGRRPNVFAGMPHALYLPRRTQVRLLASEGPLDLAYGWCVTDQDHPARYIRPQEVRIEIRGGGNATRQIHDLIPPGFDCQRLVAVEVYTPSGNWSSYPPHKHDQHREDDRGNLLEADLEEIYFYKLDRPDGYSIQRVYTSDGRLDELILARDNDVVLVPEGYHPVVSAHGFTTYYLNFLAGSAQSLANTDDPAYSWIKGIWKEKDPRLPLVTLEMEAGRDSSG